MSKLSEYVEGVVKEGFNRQLDQEENVVRSLPFVIAGVGLVGTLLTYYKPKLCKFDPNSLFSFGIYVCTWLMGACAVGILVGLFMAITRRRYDRPMDELEFLDYVQKSREYYVKIAPSIVENIEPSIQGKKNNVSVTPKRPLLQLLRSLAALKRRDVKRDTVDIQEDIDEATLADARDAITRQLAEAAGINRRNNQAKEHGRSLALNGLVILMTLAFVMICLLALRHTLAPGACHARA